ncbi:hypothetical protein D3C72_1958330 [compost metagenome]
MVSGNTPTISEAGATPRRWIAATRQMKYSRLPIRARRPIIHRSLRVKRPRAVRMGIASTRVTRPNRTKRAQLSSTGLNSGNSCGTISTSPHIAPATPA